MLQFPDWQPLDAPLVRDHVAADPGLYLLGVRMNPGQEPAPTYAGIATSLQDRLLHYCALMRQGSLSSEPRPVVQALRRVPSELWHFTYFPCPRPKEYESELIMHLQFDWPDALLLNVQENPLASGHGSVYLVERLVNHVEAFTGPLPDAPTLLHSPPKPWEAAGMSRAVWYRRQKARRLHEEGWSAEDIAQAMRVDHTTVLRWLT